MSKLGPYASYSKETGYATWHHPTAVFVGIFERINVDIKGIIHVGMWDFVEHDCYTKLVGKNVIGVEANKFVYETMSKPVADKCGYKSFNECVYSEDGLEKQFYLANDSSSLSPVGTSSVTVTTKKLSTLIEENHIDMNQYDFLNIDAEGSELDILKGFEKYLEHINVIDLETSYDDRSKSGASHQDICDWLEEHNFEIREMSSSYRTQGWGDSVFVRNNRDLPQFVDGNVGTAIYGKDYLELNWGK